MAKPFRSAQKPARAPVLLAVLALLQVSQAAAADLADVFLGVRWGESSSALLAVLGGRATPLPQPIDFGDSYAQIVRRDVALGGVPLITFFQMDKRTGGLKRIPSMEIAPRGPSVGAGCSRVTATCSRSRRRCRRRG